MGWRYRKRIKIAPGIHLNFSKRGVSTTIGPRGASVNIGPNGTYVNTGIPGTGLYNRQKISSKSSDVNIHNAFSTAGATPHRRNMRSKKNKGEISSRSMKPLIGLFFIITLALICVFNAYGSLTYWMSLIVAAPIGALVVFLLYFLMKAIRKSNVRERVEEEVESSSDIDISQAIVVEEDDLGEEDDEDGEVEEEIEEPWPPQGVEMEPYDPKLDLEQYHYPTIDLLRYYEQLPYADAKQEERNKDRLITTLRSFGVEISAVKCTIGPSVTLYEIMLAPGIRASQLNGLEDDIALSMCSHNVQIHPISSRGIISIIVPNISPHLLPIKCIIQSRCFQETTMELPCALGFTMHNDVFMFDLAKAPHLLIAGSAGQGKSMALHVIITSLLYKCHPSELKFVLMDPVGSELGQYEQLTGHFLASVPSVDSIVTNTNDALKTLESLRIEMHNRYKLFAMAGARDIREYDELFRNWQLNPSRGHKYMPRIVVVIDSYIVLATGHEQEMTQALEQLIEGARAVGIHIIVSVSHPSSDILSSAIKANMPTRISFALPESIDSHIILDCNGAEDLIRPGDMIFKNKLMFERIQCAYVDSNETQRIVSSVSSQQGYNYAFPLPDHYNDEWRTNDADIEHLDPLFEDVALYIVQTKKASTSQIQDAFSIGYNRARSLMNQLEKAGVIGDSYGSEQRKVLIHDLKSLYELIDCL